MSLVNRTQISLYEEAQAGLNSLVKQTAQVGVGLLGMLLLTGGNPPALTVGLSVVGGIAFVAWSEEKRLTKFYGRQNHYKRNFVIKSEIEPPQLSNPNELVCNYVLAPPIVDRSVSIPKERLREAGHSFKAARSAVVLSTCITIVGVVFLLSGKVQEAIIIIISSAVATSISSFKLTKEGNDRLDRIAKEFMDESE
jgi:Mg2+/citrate symporter